jgi:glycosyltransferase involved in cell wall biosynthesis
MRILYLSTRAAWPVVSGAGLRSYNLARALGTKAELTYVFFTTPGVRSPSSDEFSFCRELVAIPKPSTYTPAKIVRGLLGRWPLPVLNYTSVEMIEAARKLLQGHNYDLVHVDSIQLAGCVAALRKELRGARVMYNWHNIESELLFRYANTTPSLPRRVYARLTARRLKSVEAGVLASADGHIVCSEREREALSARAPKARIEVIENGVDTAAFGETEPPSRAPFRLLFVGSMGYHANIDAAVWFTREIWPEIRRTFPSLRLTLLGSDPTPAVLSLRAAPNVEVTGTVADLAPYYREAVAAVVPLRIGGGTRLKILEAMAGGVPVISTPLGAEGLAVTPGRDILLAETASDWMSAIASVSDSRNSNCLTKAARALVVERYEWRMIGQRLVETYERWMKERRKTAEGNDAG